MPVQSGASKLKSLKIKDMCKRLGIDPIYDSHLMHIVDEFLVAKPPAGWKEFVDPHGKAYYYCAALDKTQWKHPLEDLYKAMVYMSKEGVQDLRKRAFESPPSPLEVRDMATYMGVDLVQEAYLADICKAAVNAPLPPGWTEYEGALGMSRYFHAKSKVEQKEHPLDTYFKELVKKERARNMLDGRRGYTVEKWYRFRDYWHIPTEGHEVPYPWTSFFDIGSGKTYYFNYSAYVISWHHPGTLVRQQVQAEAIRFLQASFRGRRERTFVRRGGAWQSEANGTKRRQLEMERERRAAQLRTQLANMNLMKEEAAARVMQRFYRGYQTRQRILRMKLDVAALMVQRRWRGRVARRKALALARFVPPVTELPPPTFHIGPLAPALKPASMARVSAHAQRVLRAVDLYTHVQNLYASTPHHRSPIYGVPLLEAILEAPHTVPIRVGEHERYMCVRKKTRGLHGEETEWHLREERAAIVIQAGMRRFLAVKQADRQRLRRDASFKNREERERIAALRALEDARKLALAEAQAAALRRRVHAATRIQALFRGFQGRQTASRRREVVRVATEERRRIEREERERLRAAEHLKMVFVAKKIQAIWRGKCVRTRLRREQEAWERQQQEARLLRTKNVPMSLRLGMGSWKYGSEFAQRDAVALAPQIRTNRRLSGMVASATSDGEGEDGDVIAVSRAAASSVGRNSSDASPSEPVLRSSVSAMGSRSGSFVGTPSKQRPPGLGSTGALVAAAGATPADSAGPASRRGSAVDSVISDAVDVVALLKQGIPPKGAPPLPPGPPLPPRSRPKRDGRPTAEQLQDLMGGDTQQRVEGGGGAWEGEEDQDELERMLTPPRASGGLFASIRNSTGGGVRPRSAQQKSYHQA